MASPQTFTHYTYLGNDYTTNFSSFAGNYSVYDASDGSNDSTTNIGNALSIPSLFLTPVTLVGTTANGIVVEYYGVNYLFSDSYYSPSTSLSVNTTDPYVYCFLEGTHIATPTGVQFIECLKMGDEVITASGKVSKVRWMGRQTIHNNIKASAQHEPVLITANALGNGLPEKDLYLTGSHAVLLDGKLINASALCNGTTIRFIPLSDMPDEFTYWHIETDAHEAILANGLLAETFVDAPDRRSFDNYQEYVDFYGAERVIPEMQVPRITDKEKLPVELKNHLGISTRSTDWAALVAEQQTTLSLKQAI